MHAAPQQSLPSFTTRLSDTLSASLQRRRHSWRDLLAAGPFRTCYPHLLIHTYHYVKYSCELMELAARQLNAPRHRPVQLYFENHITEERGHEEWLLSDLEQLGFPKTVALRSFPLRS